MLKTVNAALQNASLSTFLTQNGVCGVSKCTASLMASSAFSKEPPAAETPPPRQEELPTLAIIASTCIVGGLACCFAAFGGYKLRQAAIERNSQASYKLSDMQIAADAGDLNRIAAAAPSTFEPGGQFRIAASSAGGRSSGPRAQGEVTFAPCAPSRV